MEKQRLVFRFIQSLCKLGTDLLGSDSKPAANSGLAALLVFRHRNLSPIKKNLS